MKAHPRRSVFVHSLIAGVMAVVILAGGALGAEWRAQITDTRMRETLLRQAVGIARAVDPELVAQLTFTAADRGTPAFERLREQLTAYRRVIAPRGIYTMALREEVLVFGPETYPEDDPMASPPGTIYDDPGVGDFAVFSTGQPCTIGPATDEYGTFVSALAPVIDPRTGEVLMVVGIDIMADTWQADVDVVRQAPWMTAGALAAICFGVAVALLWRGRRSAARRALWLKHFETVAIGLSGLVVTGLAVLLVHEAEQREQSYVFAAASAAQVEAVTDALREVKNNVAAIAQFHTGSQHVDCDELAVFAGSLISTNAIQGYQWIPIVRAEEVAVFEARARDEGLDGFQIWEEGGGGERVPASDREVSYPVRCAVPWDGNRAIIGFDVGSEPHLRPALEAVIQTGLATATDVYPSSFNDDGELGISVVQPIYASAEASGSVGPEANTRSLVGFVAVEVRLQSVLDLALKPYIERGPLVSLHLADLMDDGSLLMLAAHPDEYARSYPVLVDAAHADQYAVTDVHPLFVFGQTWAMVTHATPALYATIPLHVSWVLAVTGALMTAVAMALIGFLRNRETDTEEQVRLRTTELREREQNLAITLNSIGDAVIATDTQGRITRMNPVAEQLTGWPLAQAEGLPLSEVFRIVAADTRDPLEDPVARVLETGAVVTLANSTTLIARDGTERQIADNAAPIRDADGHVVGTVLAFHDVTERKLVEQTTLRQLRELSVLHAIASACAEANDEDRLTADLTRLIGEALYPDDFGLFVADEAGVLHPHASYHQHAGTPVQDIHPGEGVIGQAAERGTRRVDDVRLETNYFPGSPTSRSELAVPVKIGERVIAVINTESPEVGHFTADDERLLVTVAGQMAIALERLRLEQQTHRRLSELEALHNVSREIMAAGTDPERVYTSVHRVVAELMPAEAFAIVLRDPVSGDNEAVYTIDEGGRGPAMRFPADKGLSGHVIGHGEAILMDDLNPRSDIQVVHFGSPVSVRSFLAVPLRVNEQVIGVLSTQSYRSSAYSHHDLVLLETLANHVAAALGNIRLFRQSLEQVQRIQAILDSVPEGVLLLNAAGHILLANPAATQNLSTLADIGADATLVGLGGRPLAELLAPPPEGLWHEIAFDERTFEVAPRPVTSGLEPASYVVVIADVTHARQVRTELARQERLAAVGQLAAGIAHDFNNILAVIVLYAQLGLRDRGLPDRLRTYVKTISDQAHHAASLVQQILDFGRRAVLDPRSMDLVAFVREQAALLARTLPENIRVEATFGADAVDIHADVTRLQQLITNLAVNARDAMPDGGVLHIDVTRLRLDCGQSMPLPEMTPGLWAKIVVSDTGGGMGPNVRAHLFEPFFTTKEPGTGTGLGLAQVYGIVKQHNGHIGVETEVGIGTTFTIYLPAQELLLSAAQPAATATCPRGRGEIILVVEDNTTVRQAVVSALEMLDYRAAEAANGREALAVLENRADEIALVLSDLVMPEMGGLALLHAMGTRGLTLPVVFLSGHPVKDELNDLQSYGLVGWLSKPPDIEALSEILAQALG